MGVLRLGLALALGSSVSEDRPVERWLGYFAVPGMVLAEVEVVSVGELRDLQFCGERVARVAGERVALLSRRCQVGHVAAVRVERLFHSDGWRPEVGETVLALAPPGAWSLGRPGTRGLAALADPAGAPPPWAKRQLGSWTDLRRTVYESGESWTPRFAPTERLRLLESWSRIEDAGPVVEALRRGPPAFSLLEPRDGAIVEGDIPLAVSCAPNAADEVRVAVSGRPDLVLPVVAGSGRGYLDLTGEDGPLHLWVEFARDGQVVATIQSELLVASRCTRSWADIGGVGFRNAAWPGTDRSMVGGFCGDEACHGDEAAHCPNDCPEILGAVAIQVRVVGERTVDLSATVTLPPDAVIESSEWFVGDLDRPEPLAEPRYTFAQGGVHIVAVTVQSSIGRLSAITSVDLGPGPVPEKLQ